MNNFVLLYILFCYHSWWCSFKPSCYECTRYRQCILVVTHFFGILLLHFVWIKMYI